MPDRREFLKAAATATLLPLLLGVLAYLAVTVPRLGVFPPVGEDRPWIAAAPYKLATQGVLGSDLFAGYYGMERHHYVHMPIYPLAQAAIFKTFGVGVLQMQERFPLRAAFSCSSSSSSSGARPAATASALFPWR